MARSGRRRRNKTGGWWDALEAIDIAWQLGVWIVKGIAHAFVALARIFD